LSGPELDRARKLKKLNPEKYCIRHCYNERIPGKKYCQSCRDKHNENRKKKKEQSKK
jgi:hypothetical protein